jgi:endo-1,4-beta-D-glucanase Y
MNTDGTPRATGAAPDGEEYFVMALYFAAHRWGKGQGIYNYQAEADKDSARNETPSSTHCDGAVPHTSWRPTLCSAGPSLAQS